MLFQVRVSLVLLYLMKFWREQIKKGKNLAISGHVINFEETTTGGSTKEINNKIASNC